MRVRDLRARQTLPANGGVFYWAHDAIGRHSVHNEECVTPVLLAHVSVLVVPRRSEPAVSLHIYSPPLIELGTGHACAHQPVV
jgi:hypothetical protein